MVSAKSVLSYLKQNIGTIGAGVGGVALGSAVGYLAGSKASASKKRRKSKSTNRKRRVYTHKKGRRYTPRTAGKKRDTSHRRIRQTKNGQPYIILASGKAKFIKKSSARKSRKKKGGRY
jgi:hypothetical protein